jgi:hypothetical protein
MPAKNYKSKSRTSASSKKLKLKWWYVLPVIAIVVLAGYLIVRYSNASVLTVFNKTVANKGLITYTGTQDKQGYGKAANTPAKANINYDQSKNSKRICARVIGTDVNGTNGAQGELSLWLPAGNPQAVKFYAKGEKTVCISNQPPYYPTRIEVKKLSGSSLNVINIYGTSY